MSYTNIFIQPKRLLLVTTFFLMSVFLVACGGGGSGGSCSDCVNGVGANSPPVANAGADITVNEGDVVPLEATGTDSDGEVTGYSWSQLSDIKVTFTAVDLENGDFTFVAPDTMESLTLEFRLTVTDDQGATDTDTYKVTVEPVNMAPEIPPGQVMRRHDGYGAQVVVNAFDADGAVVAYQWSQLSGPEVELTNADTLVASIPMQDIIEPTDYSFQVTVTDNEGATTTGSVDYILYPANYPHVNPSFPPVGSTLQSDRVRMFGTAYTGAGTGATIESVTVTVEPEGVAVPASVIGTGHADWSLADVNIPLSENIVTLVLTVTDSEGRSFPRRVSFGTGEQAGGGPALSDVVDVAVPKFGFTYVLTSGSFLSDIDIVPVLFAGYRLEEISDNSDSGLGPQISGPVCMIVNKDTELDEDNILYVGTLNSEAPLIAVNAETGVRTLITGPEKGEGPDIDSVMGMAFGETANDLYVADNVGAAIYHVDISSGNRTYIADINTTQPVMYPLDVAYDSASNRLYVSQNITDYTSVMSIDLGDSPATATVLSDDSNVGPELEPYSHGIHLSGDGSNLYFFNAANDQMLEIDLATGDRREIANGVTGSSSSDGGVNWKGADLDSWADILYVVGGDGGSRDGLYAIDAVSGSKVLISR